MFSYICNISVTKDQLFCMYSVVYRTNFKRDQLALLKTSYKRKNGEVQVLNK